MSMVYEAHLLAKKYHEGQLYGEVPYLDHLYAVAESATENYHGLGEDHIFAVALLHDILEDTDCTIMELQEKFPPSVVLAVKDITKVKGEPYTNYILKVRENAWALHVKTHDTLCNLTESVHQGDKRRVLKYSSQLVLLTEDIMKFKIILDDQSYEVLLTNSEGDSETCIAYGDKHTSMEDHAQGFIELLAELNVEYELEDAS